MQIPALLMETIQVLKLLASSHCELHDDLMFSEMLLSGKFHRLEYVFIRGHTCMYEILKGGLTAT